MRGGRVPGRHPRGQAAAAAPPPPVVAAPGLSGVLVPLPRARWGPGTRRAPSVRGGTGSTAPQRRAAGLSGHPPVQTLSQLQPPEGSCGREQQQKSLRWTWSLRRRKRALCFPRAAGQALRWPSNAAGLGPGPSGAFTREWRASPRAARPGKRLLERVSSPRL